MRNNQSMPISQFTHIGIIGKRNACHALESIKRVITLLQQRQIMFTLDKASIPKALRSHARAQPIERWPSDIDLTIVVGGDGTFLHAGRVLLKKNIPLLGINAGRLGFLADVSSDEIEVQLNAILDGDYVLETRHTLSVSIMNAQQRCHGHFFAINDAVIHKRTMARMVELEAYTRGHFLCHYRVDGLIIATSTGSTAYALSAGGPILEPNMDALIIAPICPHTLTQRPVVVGADSDIDITLGVDSHDVQITIDGQEEMILATDNIVRIRPAQPLPVIHPRHYQFQARLRQKLNWGLAPEQPENSHYA